MTGIERLRTLAAARDEWILGGTLADIADEIERERACDADTIENIRLIVGGVIDDMERHVSGHEGADDSHVARWARELRSLRDWRDNAEPVYPMTVLLRRCKEFGVDTSDCEDGEDVLNNLIETLRQRLMPEGMEWPRYESGEPVRVGDVVSDVEVRSVVFRDGGILLSDCTSVPGWGTWRSYKEPIKRPSVPAADGEPLEVGQTVWDTNGDELVIGALEDGGHTVACRYADVGDGIPVHGMWSPSDLTHQRPVLDADGVPIHEGDTVWRLTDGKKHEVTGINPRFGDIRVKDESMELGVWDSADGFTHAKPEIDTWQRIEEDAEKDPCSYFGFDGEETCGKCPASGKNCEQTMALDLVRRAKALAERDA